MRYVKKIVAKLSHKLGVHKELVEQVNTMGELLADHVLENQALRSALKLMHKKAQRDDESTEQLVAAILLQNGHSETIITGDLLHLASEYEIHSSMEDGNVRLDLVRLEEANISEQQ